MRVLFLGRDDKPTLQTLRAAGDDVVAVNERIDVDTVRALGVEAIVSHDYGHLVPADVLSEVPLAVNLHVSLLPWNRGTHPNLWSFVDDTPKGVTIHVMDAGVDTGDILAQRELAFDGDAETLATTHGRLQDEIAALFAEVWPSIRDGSATRRPQTWAGTYHRDADLEAVREMLVAGWDSPVAGLAGVGRRLREQSPARPRILIRCDGSPKIGSGHVTRCRSLAQALRSRGSEVRFAMRVTGGAGATQVAGDGFAVDALPGDADGAALDARDLEALLEAAERFDASCVLVDHYGAGEEYLAGVAGSGVPLAMLDDRADRDLRSAVWLLNQNLAAPSLDVRVSPGCVLLLGCEFALLRPQFAAARSSLVRGFSDRDRNVLITLGGGDTGAEAAAALTALEAVPRALSVRVVIGADAPTRAAVEASAAASGHEVEVLGAVEDMAAQMAWADLSVNAGGSTCWELMCLGVPMVVTSLSADQSVNPQPLTDAGVAAAVSMSDWATAAELVDALLADPGRRAEMSTRATALVDGRGAQRAAASIETLHAGLKAVANAGG